MYKIYLVCQEKICFQFTFCPKLLKIFVCRNREREREREGAEREREREQRERERKRERERDVWGPRVV